MAKTSTPLFVRVRLRKSRGHLAVTVFPGSCVVRTHLVKGA